MPSIRPSTWAGTPLIMCSGGLPEALRPALAHEVVVAADAAAGDDDGLGADLEVADDLARAGRAAGDVARREHVAADAVDDAAGRRQLVDAVAEAQRHQAAVDSLLDPPDERLEHTGPVPQVMWKRGTELPWPVAR